MFCPGLLTNCTASAPFRTASAPLPHRFRLHRFRTASAPLPDCLFYENAAGPGILLEKLISLQAVSGTSSCTRKML
jgi:hypothetical protein